MPGSPSLWCNLMQMLLLAKEKAVVCCRGSLERLSLPQIGLYQIHWPGFLTQGYSNDAFVRGLAQCCQKGLTQAVGISNFRADRVRTAASILEVHSSSRRPRMSRLIASRASWSRVTYA